MAGRNGGIMMKRIAGLMFMMMSLSSLGFAREPVNLSPQTPQQWQQYLEFRRTQVLDELYDLRPEAKQELKRAEGYAVFTNFGLKVLFVGGAAGRGIVHDNKTGDDVYMRMAQANVGFGLGIKDFRAVFVFHDRKVLENFVNSGWSFGGEVDAAVKGADAGAAASGAIRVAPGLRVYQLTENGLALDVGISGTKYWKDGYVNP